MNKEDIKSYEEHIRSSGVSAEYTEMGVPMTKDKDFKYDFGTMEEMLDSLFSIENYINNYENTVINNSDNLIKAIFLAFVERDDPYVVNLGDKSKYKIRVQSTILYGKTIKIWKYGIDQPFSVFMTNPSYKRDKYIASYTYDFKDTEFKYKDFSTNPGMLTWLTTSSNVDDKIYSNREEHTCPIIQLDNFEITNLLDVFFASNSTDICEDMAFSDNENHVSTICRLIRDELVMMTCLIGTKIIHLNKKYEIRFDSCDNGYDFVLTIFSVDKNYKYAREAALCIVSNMLQDPIYCITRRVSYPRIVFLEQKREHLAESPYYNELPKKKWWQFGKK